jgi:signal transduction histidine kinase
MLSKFNKLQIIRVVYWLFLTYMVAAFIWWYISLVKQSEQIADVQFNTLQTSDPTFTAKVKSIQDFQLRKNKQYIGEGLTFLFLFLLGAIYVYRSLVKQIRYSNQQQNFMMAVTHELKTPIAITQLNLETLLKRDLEEAQQKNILQVSLKETQRLDYLCNNILLASQIDMGNYKANVQAVDFSAIVNSLITQLKSSMPQRKINTFIDNEVFIKGEPVLIQLLVNNLLDNAIKYSCVETDIDVCLQQQENSVVFMVKDQGVGVPVEERQNIFEKFYRVGSEFSRSTKGTGLGLYLCKRIADLHKSTLTVTANSPAGSIFTFTYFIS